MKLVAWRQVERWFLTKSVCLPRLRVVVVRPSHLVAVKSPRTVRICQQPVVRMPLPFAVKVCLAFAYRPVLPKLCAVQCKARWPAPWELVGVLRLAVLLKVRCA